MKDLTVTSSAFEPNRLIPRKYTCDGENVSPPLNIEGVPKEAKTLALIVEDPDAPRGLWVHWVVWNITPTAAIKENSIPGTEGLTTAGTHGYSGPCPPSGTHRYFFKVYALDSKLELKSSSQKEDVEAAMEGHVLAKGELVGLYNRGK